MGNDVIAARSRARRTIGGSNRKLGIVGAVVVIIMLVVCVGSLPYTMGRQTGGQLEVDRDRLPQRYEATHPDLGMLPPFWAPHVADERERVDSFAADKNKAPLQIFGTDRLGRDVFIRSLAGGGISLGIGFAAAGLAVLIGTVYGTIAGAMGGRIDAFMMRIVDIFYGLPYILLVVLLAVAADGIIERIDANAFASQDKSSSWLSFMQRQKSTVNVMTLFIAIGSVSWLTLARVIRGQVLSLKQQPFMEACRAIGVPWPRQFLRHLLPNLVGPIVVYATLTVPAAILSESFLSFLGIGVQEPLPSWGNLAAAGLSELNIVRVRWWLLFWPCLLIAVTLLALNFMGEGLREALDPKRAAIERPT